jgi:hypothetical protein
MARKIYLAADLLSDRQGVVNQVFGVAPVVLNGSDVGMITGGTESTRHEVHPPYRDTFLGFSVS